MPHNFAEYMRLELDFLIDMIVLDPSDEATFVRDEAIKQAIIALLLKPQPRIESAWQALWRSQDNDGFVVALGMDVATFNYILDSGFRNTWDTSTIPRGGVDPSGFPRLSRRSLDAPGALGLVLCYLRKVSNEMVLQAIFAVVPSSLNRYVHFALEILHELLPKLPECRFLWPTHQEMMESANWIQDRHPMIHGAFRFMDGLKLPCQTSDDPMEQNAMYNGWCRAHTVSNVIVFAPNGMIIDAVINAPGSWHNARVTQDVCDMLLDQTPPGFFLLADSAFLQVDPVMREKVHTPLKKGMRFNGMQWNKILQAKQYSNAVVSARQAVEWGMRAIQGSFGRLRMPLDAHDKHGRQRLIEVCL
ncbi:hypothetical protein FRC09_020637 [Ceratobasidium sp. 395]|nr:hypothetical protein FRC09_020637 [Ceratobasidium sp. 395]